MSRRAKKTIVERRRRDGVFEHCVVETRSAEAKAVGYHNCDGCGAETPFPPEEVFADVAGNGDGFIWPFDDWFPGGWTNWSTQGRQYHLCPPCSDKVSAVVGADVRRGATKYSRLGQGGEEKRE